MKFIPLFLLLVSFSFSLRSQPSHYHLEITLTDSLYQGYIYLYTLTEGKTDSAKFHNGHCKFYNPCPPEPVLAILTFGELDGNYKEFVLNTDSLRIKGCMRNWKQATYENAEDTKLYQEFEQQFSAYEEALGEIKKQYLQALRQRDSITLKKCDEQFASKAQEERQYIFPLVQKYKDRFGIAIAIHSILVPRTYLKPGEFRQVYEIYSERLKNSSYGQTLHQISGKSTHPFLNTPMYAFQFPDHTGTPKQLKDFSGKYFLIDLWASWCGPCRVMNEHLKKYYSIFHPRGLEIIAISIDQNRTSWQKAIQDPQLSWPQLCDSTGWNSSLVSHYQLQGIPANWLLDQSGRIIAMDLDAGKLYEKLKELMP